jgi:hypothetical protein
MNDGAHGHERDMLGDLCPELGHERAQRAKGMLLDDRFWF